MAPTLSDIPNMLCAYRNFQEVAAQVTSVAFSQKASVCLTDSGYSVRPVLATAAAAAGECGQCHVVSVRRRLF